jgi:putative endonuclease
MKIFTSETQKLGEIGENAVCTYLKGQGLSVRERNFTRKWGEIDIVAFKDGVTHFIEVKSLSREGDAFRPEDQVHPTKQRRLARAIESYMLAHEVGDWRFDIACVFLDMDRRMARVRIVPDVILGALR